MEQLGNHLHLVFSEDGDDPLVLENSWAGLPHRESPELRNVGQAKPRLRALSILLLLAKYHESRVGASEEPLTFQAEIEDNTWICTLANAVPDVVEWVKRRLHIRDQELFLFGSPGSTHNPGGKKYPLVEFYPKKLPLKSIQLFVKPAKPPHAERRLLRGDELLAFALKLESKHWIKSAISSLYSAEIEADDFGKKHQPGFQIIPVSNDALFQAFAAESQENVESNQPVEWKQHFDLIFRVLLEKEFDRYRENCRPFFSFMGNSLYSAKLPFLWQPYVWNNDQIALLHANCLYYAFWCQKPIEDIVERRWNFHEPKFRPQIWSEIQRPLDIVESAFGLFNGLECLSACRTQSVSRAVWPKSESKWSVRFDDYREILIDFDDSSPLILDEARECVRRLVSGLAESNPAIAAGTFFVQQIMLIDFLAEVCLPFYEPDEPSGKRCQELPQIIYCLKKEAAENRDIIGRVCNGRADFLEAARAGRSLLAAQVAFWGALHRRLLAGES